jgi:hypothetical protein
MKDQDQLLDLQTTDSFRLYLDEVGRHPLLTKEDEIELSQAYEAGLDAQLKLADTTPTPPPGRTWKPPRSGASGPGAR